MPYLVSESRLKIIGKCLSLSILALGIDLNWGFTGLLSLGQGIFFALGGYAIAMYLNLNSAINGLPEFFGIHSMRVRVFFLAPEGSNRRRLNLDERSARPRPAQATSSCFHI